MKLKILLLIERVAYMKLYLEVLFLQTYENMKNVIKIDATYANLS